MPCANGIWSVGRRNRNEDFEMSADDRNCTGRFGVDAFCLALHGADLHIRSGAWSTKHGNVVITNLNKMDKVEALELVSALRQSIQSSAESNEGYAREFTDIPLVGRTIFEQQQLLYRALLEWLDHFEGQFLKE